MTELPDGIHDVPAGKLATIVTHLEMRARPQRRDIPFPDGVILRPVPADLVWYRRMFRLVGADWLWFSRLRLDDRALDAIIGHEDVGLFTLTRDGEDLALLEMDFRQPGACELAFFGVAGPLMGTGAGRALMNAAIEQAWSRPIARFHVHTCTLDSPQALGFYIRSGFSVTHRQVEIADDPRILGLLPETAGAHVPIAERQIRPPNSSSTAS